MPTPDFFEILENAERIYKTENIFIQHKDGKIEPAIDFAKNDWISVNAANLYDKNTRDYLWYDYKEAANTMWYAMREQSGYTPGLFFLFEYYSIVARLIALRSDSIDKTNGKRLYDIEQRKIKRAKEAEARKKAKEDAKINPVKDMFKYLKGRHEFCDDLSKAHYHPAEEGVDVSEVRRIAGTLADNYREAAVSLGFAHIEGKGLTWVKEFLAKDPYHFSYTWLFRYDVSRKRLIRKHELESKKDAKT